MCARIHVRACSRSTFGARMHKLVSQCLGTNLFQQYPQLRLQSIPNEDSNSSYTTGEKDAMELLIVYDSRTTIFCSNVLMKNITY